MEVTTHPQCSRCGAVVGPGGFGGDSLHDEPPLCKGCLVRETEALEGDVRSAGAAASAYDYHVGAGPLRVHAPSRRCQKCRGVARCLHATVRRVNGLPAGTTYDYRCEGCGRAFTVWSTWQVISSAASAGFIALLGLSFVFSARNTNDTVWTSLIALAGLGYLAMTGWRIYNAVTNPVIEASSGGD